MVWPHYQTQMSLLTAGIYCAISPYLSSEMEDCSIVRVQQLQMLYRRRCCMLASQHMFGSLWNVVIAHIIGDKPCQVPIVLHLGLSAPLLSPISSSHGGTAPAAPPPFRPGKLALSGSRPLVTPYYCRLGDLLCYIFVSFQHVLFRISVCIVFFVLFLFSFVDSPSVL